MAYRRYSRTRNFRQARKPESSALAVVGAVVALAAFVLWIYPKPVAKLVGLTIRDDANGWDTFAAALNYHRIVGGLPWVCVTGVLLMVFGVWKARTE